MIYKKTIHSLYYTASPEQYEERMITDQSEGALSSSLDMPLPQQP